MKSKITPSLALALSTFFLCCCQLSLADESTTITNPPAPPTNRLYHNAHYGFQLTLPPGWEARETSLSVNHYGYTFLTLNNQRPELTFEGWEGTWLNHDRVTQLQPGESYIAIGNDGSPMGTSMQTDGVGADPQSSLGTNDVRVSSSSGQSYYSLSFFKRGQRWTISACLKEPVTKETRQQTIALMQSLRFVDGPVKNASWAESLAWPELPEKIRATENRWFGWPSVGQEGESSGSGILGERSVLVTNLGPAYSVKFALQAIGQWEFLVQTNGEVQAKPPALQTIGPPPLQWPSDLPGTSAGKIDSYWVAPYVQATTVSRKTTLAWFSPDQHLKQSIEIGYLQPGFAEDRSSPPTIRGINEDWQISLPHGPGDIKTAGFITSTPDSRVFVYERHPLPGQIELNIYIHGQLAHTVGPFWQYSACDVVLNDDGSTAILITPTNRQSDAPLSGKALREKLLAQTRAAAQIVALNTNGEIQFQTDCGPAVYAPIVAPDGAGVLLRPNTGAEPNTLKWFTKNGLQHSLIIAPNPEFAGWIPDTCQSLFSTSLGFQSGPYELIDWPTGKKLWTIPCPGRGEVLALALTPELILFSVAEPWPSGVWHEVNQSLLQSGHEWVRTFYAVETRTGNLVARWPGQFPHRYLAAERDHFLRLGEKLYYITTDEYAEINPADITAKTHGWR